jgi:hypothetical protein
VLRGGDGGRRRGEEGTEVESSSLSFWRIVMAFRSDSLEAEMDPWTWREMEVVSTSRRSCGRRAYLTLKAPATTLECTSARAVVFGVSALSGDPRATRQAHLSSLH